MNNRSVKAELFSKLGVRTGKGWSCPEAVRIHEISEEWVNKLLQANQPKPLYLQLQDDIKQNIRFKEYAVGDQMPSEEELCIQYGVSRITVRRAIQGLVDAGLLEKHRGKGTFVAVPKHVVSTNNHGGFSKYLEKEGRRSQQKILEKAYRHADARQAAMLGINEGDRIVFIRRLVSEDGFPLAIDELSVSAERFPDLMELFENDVSFYDLLANHYHVEYGSSEITLDVSTAKVEEAHLLCCATGNPLFILRKQMMDAQKVPVHYSKSVVRGDRVTYMFKTESNIMTMAYQPMGPKN